jgi:selenoprotein W-related protein
LTTKLLTTYKQKIQSLTLIPSKGGCFELSVDGKLVFSKLESGTFPEEPWAVEAVGSRLKK